jgi:predicted CXXCH cytochrome family protein
MNLRTLSVISLFAAVSVFSTAFVPEAQALISGHDCADCHSVMGASGSTLLNDASVEVLCMSCHATGIGSVAAVDVHTNGGVSFPSTRITCIECHDSHDNQQNINGVDNLNMVLGTITVMNPSLGYDINAVFADKDYSDGSYDYTKPDGTGICQVCHTMTRNQLNDGTNSRHNEGKTCTTSKCHPHSNGFDK